MQATRNTVYANRFKFCELPKEVFNVFILDLLPWLGFLFDIEMSNRLQILAAMTLRALDTCERFVRTNRSVTMNLMKDARGKTAPYIMNT